MKATTEPTLTALAEAGDHGSARLALDPELYPPASRAAAAEAFAGHCRLRQSPEGEVTVTVADPSAVDARRVIGEFFNFMLMHAIQQRLESETS